jgi:uncharacterized membrane protein YhhN
MIPGLVIVLAVAVVDWIAVAKGWTKVEKVAKPWTLAALLLLFLFSMLEWNSPNLLPMLFVAIGLAFCLAGDVFLLLSERWFIAGLVAFLLGHVCYILGLNIPLPNVSPIWSFGMAILIALISSRVLRPIITSVRNQGKAKLGWAILIYGMVISIMLLSALLTLYNKEWGTLAAGLVAAGASLFFFSDVILAWNKFVSPIKNGRVVNVILYHLGQISLAVGVILQFTG